MACVQCQQIIYLCLSHYHIATVKKMDDRQEIVEAFGKTSA